MKILLRLAKKSAKENYKFLRNQSPFFCNTLKAEVMVSKIFFNHVVYHTSKNREEREIIERILLFPFIKSILKNGKLQETRKENTFYLVSCFRDFQQ